MSHIKPIIAKELRQYFNSPIAYIILAVFLVISSWLFFRGFFVEGQATMRAFFGFLPTILLFLVPAITMRLWSEERKQGTTELLFTWPIRTWEPVVGKFLASLIFMAVAFALTLPIPLSIATMGALDWGIVMTSYIGALFMSGAFLAIGMWISSLTENQIVAFIISITACFALYIVGEPLVTYGLPTWLAILAQGLGLGQHFGSIARGVLDSRDILYYLSVITLFLVLNVQQIKARAWK